MTTPLLVRHPAPFPTESLLGYILRLTEVNGYTTPWSLFLLAQIRQHEARSTGMKVAKLARVYEPARERTADHFLPMAG